MCETARNMQKHAKYFRQSWGRCRGNFICIIFGKKLSERLRILNLVGFGAGIKLRLNVLKLNGERDEIKLVWWQRDETQD